MIRRLNNEYSPIMEERTYTDPNTGILKPEREVLQPTVINLPIENAIPQQNKIIEEIPIQVKEESIKPVILPDITQQAITNEEILSNDKTLIALANSLKDIE